jgi:hypothetical protein
MPTHIVIFINVKHILLLLPTCPHVVFFPAVHKWFSYEIHIVFMNKLGGQPGVSAPKPTNQRPLKEVA